MGIDVADAGMEIEAAGIPRGWNLFPREPRGDTLEILQTIKVRVQALEYQVNGPVKFLMWLQNVQLIAGSPYSGLAAKRRSDAGQLQYMLPVKFLAATYRAVTEHNINENGEDGKKLVRGWQGWIRKYTGVDGRKGCRNVWGWD